MSATQPDIGLPPFAVMPGDPVSPDKDHDAPPCSAQPLAFPDVLRLYCQEPPGHELPHVASGETRVFSIWNDEWFVDKRHVIRLEAHDAEQH